MRRVACLLLVACSSSNDSDTAPAIRTVGTCPPMRPGAPPPTDLDAVQALVDDVRAELFPELDGASIEVVELDSETDYFQANLDISTVGESPLERAYRVLANPLLFDDPPSQPAVAAILAHELTHVRDYTELDSAELVEFGLWYATEDTAAYERETDEHALWLGCADGLIAYREWLYAHIPASALADKQRSYYTPDEIREWQRLHGG